MPRNRAKLSGFSIGFSAYLLQYLRASGRKVVIMQFEFATAARIVYGAGQHKQLGALAAEYGRRALVVTSGGVGRYAALLALLDQAGVTTESYVVAGEPSIDTARQGAETARAFAADMVISVGGGSAIDAGKAVAALVANGGDPMDYLEVIGAGKPLAQPSLPFIAVPTTAGTGSEVTRNAVLASPEHRVKVSMRSPHMLAKIALVDPELTYSLPAAITASSGIDALTQLIEPFTCSAPNPLTDGVCREGMRRAASLQRAYETGDAASRDDMALASLFGGLALANARLGAAHGIAGPLGGMFPIPHGVACGRLLTPVMQTNIRALSERAPAHPALRRYAEVAVILTGYDEPAAGVAFVSDLVEALNLPRLRAFGIAPADFAPVAERAARASSMKGNPIPLTEAEIVGILEAAY
jgi:alcohol dehydrogenase class IV